MSSQTQLDLLRHVLT